MRFLRDVAVNTATFALAVVGFSAIVLAPWVVAYELGWGSVGGAVLAGTVYLVLLIVLIRSSEAWRSYRHVALTPEEITNDRH